MKIKGDRYVVTGINRLTGQREAISRPKLYGTALEMLERAKRRVSRTRVKAAYAYLRVDKAVEYVQQAQKTLERQQQPQAK